MELSTHMSEPSRIQVFAQYAEIVASIGVIATLLFLAFEVNRNSELIKTSMYDSQVEVLIEWRQHLATNKENRELFFRYEREGVGKFSVDEVDHIVLIQNSLWAIYERAYFARKRDLLGPEEWTRFNINICDQRSKDPVFWEERLSFYLTSEFKEFVRTECAS